MNTEIEPQTLSVDFLETIRSNSDFSDKIYEEYISQRWLILVDGETDPKISTMSASFFETIRHNKEFSLKIYEEYISKGWLILVNGETVEYDKQNEELYTFKEWY